VTLNGTLIVQAINFCIAYFLLRWLYFKPAIAQIQQEEEVYTHFKNTILERALVIEQKKQQQKEYWLECQRYCKEEMPSIQKPDFLALKYVTPSLEPLFDDAIQLKKLSEAVTDVLVQRIDHVS